MAFQAWLDSGMTRISDKFLASTREIKNKWQKTSM